MYEQFSKNALGAMRLANSEAQQFNHEYIGPEHVLLALIKLPDGVAANVLRQLDVDLQKVRLDLENSMESGPDEVRMGKLPQTPGMKNVIEYAKEEAQNLNHRCVGTQHLLLGLLREQKGVAVAALSDTLEVTLEDARANVAQTSEEQPLLSPHGPDQDVRYAIKSCWTQTQNVDEVERQVSRIVDRALRDFRENFEEFFLT